MDTLFTDCSCFELPVLCRLLHCTPSKGEIARLGRKVSQGAEIWNSSKQLLQNPIRCPGLVFWTLYTTIR